MPRQISRRRALEAKYRARRIAIILLFPIVIGVGVWFVSGALGSEPNAEEGTIGITSYEEISPISESSGLLGIEGGLSRSGDPGASPAGFWLNPGGFSSIYDLPWYLQLVSAANPLPDDFTPPELVTITDNHRVDARVADSLIRMITMARADGIVLEIHSSFRTVERQRELFYGRLESQLAQGRSEEDAIAAVSLYTAYPGSSEHHTGLVVDILSPEHRIMNSAFADTQAFRWLSENAHLYGFIMRYPADRVEITGIAFEPWHYRYVGVNHAIAIRESGLTLEEYLYVLIYGNNPPPELEDTDYPPSP